MLRFFIAADADAALITFHAAIDATITRDAAAFSLLITLLILLYTYAMLPP